MSILAIRRVAVNDMFTLGTDYNKSNLKHQIHTLAPWRPAFDFVADQATLAGVSSTHSSARNWGMRSHNHAAKPSMMSAPRTTVIGSLVSSATAPARSAPTGIMPKKPNV
jgi:hypothetical protein